MRRTYHWCTALLLLACAGYSGASVEVTKGAVQGGSIQKPYVDKGHIEGPSVRVGVHGVSVDKGHVQRPTVHRGSIQKPQITGPEVVIKPGQH